MKKMTKLLSVILAFVMALSCMTMMASAEKANYKNVADLEGKSAYSRYGAVTRLDTETRLSILLDSLDIMLADANIKLADINVLGIKVKLDFSSVNNIFASIDSIYNNKSLVNTIGTLSYLYLNGWTSGMTREGKTQLELVNALLKFLSDNANIKNKVVLTTKDKTFFDKVLTDGIDLGIIKSFVPIDMNSINNLIKNLPNTIESIVLPLFSRQDDDATQRNILGNNTDDALITVAQNFVNGLFTKQMNWTSYREDEAGNDLGYTTTLPTQADGKSRYFVKEGNQIHQYDYQYAGLLGDPKAGYKEEPTVTYTKAKEYESDDCTTYVYRAPEGYSGDQTLKWYKADNKADANGRIQSGYWIPSLVEPMTNGTVTLNINGTDSLLGLLYKFAPYLFAEMAPTVLNGSVKYELAKAFGVSFEHIGSLKSANVANTQFNPDADLQAVINVVGDIDNFFTKAQEYYVWEYSDYKVIDGVPYYRFQNDYYKGTLPKDLSAYYSMFNWDWEITDNFLNEFIPGTTEFTNAARGNTFALEGLNDLVAKAINTVIKDSWTVKGTTYTRSEVFNWVAGGNDKLLNNLMVCARNFFNIAPEEIVDEYFEEAQFYNAMMNGTMKQAVNGLVCELVKLIMPQIKFPDGIVNEQITAIAAIVVRELCTQLMPSYNFDAMIYANYGNSANKTRAIIAGKSADYWLDTTLYMGVNLGMYYLRNIADIGEDKENGYYSVMSALGALPAIDSDKKNTTLAGDAFTFAADSQYVNGTASWLYGIDWIIDWALDKTELWCWHFERFVDVEGGVGLTTYENPLKKINSVILTFIPDLEKVINTEGLNGTDYGSGTFLEKVLKDGIVDNIVNLNVTGILNMLKVPTDSVLRNDNIANTIVGVVKNLLNGILKKVAGGTDIVPAAVTSVDTLLNQANLRTTILNLVGKLYEASNTYHIFDPLLPIANFFIGWKMDAQTFADPVVYFSNSWGSTYLNKDNTPTLNFINNSSGMLQKHRGSDKTDSHYTINVTGITFNDGLSATETVFSVIPGETKSVALTLPADFTGVTEIDIHYNFTGKNGQAIGGEQVRKEYIYCSAITDDLNTPRDSGALGATTQDKDWTGISNYRRYEFTKNIFDSITNYQATVVSTSTYANLYKRSPSAMVTDRAPTAPASEYFAHLNDYNAAGFVQVGNESTSSGYMYKAKDGVTFETEFPYGTYDMGQEAIKYGSSSKQVEVTFIYYNDYDIGKIAKQYSDYHLMAEGFVDQTLWATYEAALKEVLRLAGVAKKTDYVETVQPLIQPAIKALESAHKALMASPRTAAATTIDNVKNAYNTCENDPVNYQNYKLYEYFQYEKQRNSASSMINATIAPADLENIIKDGVSGNDLIAAITGAQTNANIITGINATVLTPDAPERAEEKKANAQAKADFVPASYSDVELQNQETNLLYYYGFLIEKAPVKDFLKKEIDYAKAQGYVESQYSADSWSRYVKALANAEAMYSSNTAKNSTIFDTKYELMVAQNKLQLKERSMKEVGYMNEELVPLIDKANVILNNFGTSTSLYTAKAGITDAEALGQLVRALGVRYDVTLEDGTSYEGILYNNSALTFTDYDRISTAKNKKAVDMAADKLRTAIENFECTAVIESVDNVTTVDQGVRYIQGIVPNSIPTEKALLDRLTVTGGTPVVTVSKAGQFGTGTRIDLKSGEDLLATYFVVIYGDVNGDGAVDAFDALEVDYANCSAYYMGGVYDDAADLDGDGVVTDADYAALVEGVQCKGTISQDR